MIYEDWLVYMKKGRWVLIHGEKAVGKVRYMEWRCDYKNSKPYEISNSDYLFIYINDTGYAAAGIHEPKFNYNPICMWNHKFDTWLEGAKAIREKLQID